MNPDPGGCYGADGPCPNPATNLVTVHYHRDPHHFTLRLCDTCTARPVQGCGAPLVTDRHQPLRRPTLAAVVGDHDPESTWAALLGINRPVLRPPLFRLADFEEVTP